MEQTPQMGLLGTDAARPLHYRFGQVTLRALASKDPARLVELAQRGVLATGLASVWTAMAEQLPEEDRYPPDGISASAHEIGDRVIVLVALPEAQHINEPYVVAVVLRGDQVERYLVLEHSWNLDDTPSTWIGEWTEHDHRSLGQGPAPDPDAFLGTISRLIEQTGDEGYLGGFRFR
jgi:hypothetical protein